MLCTVFKNVLHIAKGGGGGSLFQTMMSLLSTDLQSCLICIACRMPRPPQIPVSTESFITKQDPTGSVLLYTQICTRLYIKYFHKLNQRLNY